LLATLFIDQGDVGVPSATDTPMALLSAQMSCSCEIDGGGSEHSGTVELISVQIVFLLNIRLQQSGRVVEFHQTVLLARYFKLTYLLHRDQFNRTGMFVTTAVYLHKNSDIWAITRPWECSVAEVDANIAPDR